jgi:hypothetical protein
LFFPLLVLLLLVLQGTNNTPHDKPTRIGSAEELIEIVIVLETSDGHFVCPQKCSLIERDLSQGPTKYPPIFCAVSVDFFSADCYRVRDFMPIADVSGDHSADPRRAAPQGDGGGRIAKVS